MQDRTCMRQSIWHFTKTLLNLKAMLPIMAYTSGVTPGTASCCDAVSVEIFFLNILSNVLASEEMFLENYIIISSISSLEPRFLFFPISDGGVCF